MNQILTIFRAEGPRATRLVRLCRTTRKAQLFDLREAWREQVRAGAGFTAYAEYMDTWLMGDDFTRVMGVGTGQRYTPSGVVYFCLVTAELRKALRRQARQKHQFPEQTFFVNTLAGLACGSGSCEPPIALAVFREVLGGSSPDDRMDRRSHSRKKGRT